MINTLRFETTEGGPGNVAEFGSLSTKDGYIALKEMDAYSHVVDGAKYPAVLLTGGLNDHRVPVWMAAEMAARLRAASASGKPIRLRVDFEGGHHMMGAAKADQISQATDTFAFVLEHTGDPAFQPPAKMALNSAH
jgi:prolyl oligopeptidase